MFTDTDALEEDMGVRCEDMSAQQLITYIKDYQLHVNKVDLRIDGLRERAVFQGLKRIYGDKTAGLIVKWAMLHYKGRYRGEIIQFFDFQKGRKWWTDQLYLELQQATRKEESRKAEPVPAGFASMDALL